MQRPDQERSRQPVSYTHLDVYKRQVVDTQKSRLYLYKNDTDAGGRPRFVADYYMTHGKLGSDKRREGDKKPPVGVYHVTTSLPTQRLGDL